MKIFLLLLIPFIFLSCGERISIMVESGDHARYNSVIRLQLSEKSGKKNLMAEADNGVQHPLQFLPNGEAIFIIPEMKAHQKINFSIKESNKKFTKIISSENNGVFGFTYGELPLLTYQFEPNLPNDTIPEAYRRGGYIHPVYSPKGKIVTDDFAYNHLHHHGIWAAWTKTRFQDRKPDFWNMGNETGTVVPVALDSTWSGPVMAGLKARHQYIDLSAEDNVAAIKESWEINVYPMYSGTKKFTMFDLHQVNQCATDDPLYLPEYHYGGVGFRGHEQWNGEENTFFLTSEGKTRKNGHATKADWCHIGGLIDGEMAGITIMCHPDNFRAPQPMRIHPSEPFFCYAPSQDGDWAINPGNRYESRYRYIIYDGEPDTELINTLWLDYSDPPVITVIHQSGFLFF